MAWKQEGLEAVRGEVQPGCLNPTFQVHQIGIYRVISTVGPVFLLRTGAPQGWDHVFNQTRGLWEWGLAHPLCGLLSSAQGYNGRWELQLSRTSHPRRCEPHAPSPFSGLFPAHPSETQGKKKRRRKRPSQSRHRPAQVCVGGTSSPFH